MDREFVSPFRRPSMTRNGAAAVSSSGGSGGGKRTAKGIIIG